MNFSLIQAVADSYADDCQSRLFLCELAGIYIQIKKAFTELKMGSFGNFSFWAFRGWVLELFIFNFHVSFHSFKLPAKLPALAVNNSSLFQLP